MDASNGFATDTVAESKTFLDHVKVIIQHNSILWQKQTQLE